MSIDDVDLCHRFVRSFEIIILYCFCFVRKADTTCTHLTVYIHQLNFSTGKVLDRVGDVNNLIVSSGTVQSMKTQRLKGPSNPGIVSHSH